MFYWLVTPLMAMAAGIAAIFVARDSANFGVVQMVVSVLLLAALVALLVFWGPIMDWRRRGRRGPRWGGRPASDEARPGDRARLRPSPPYFVPRDAGWAETKKESRPWSVARML